VEKKSSVRMTVFIIVVICALFIWQSKVFSEAKQVTIIMEKTEYEVGEKVTANADFDGVIYLWSHGCWSVQKWTDGEWVTIARNGCISTAPCAIVNSDKLEQCKSILCERDSWYETQLSDPHNNYYAQWVWNQEYEVARKTYSCEMYGNTTDDECIVYGQATPGRYKIRFEYAFSIDKNEILKKDGIDINYFEKEFIIK
jgi:hypothetical protein